MFGWLKKKKAVSLEVKGQEQAPVLGSGRGWIDNEGVFWHRKGPVANPVAKDVFLIDAALVEHGGDNWTEPITVLETSALAIEKGGEFAKSGTKMRKKALRDLADLSRKVFGLDALGEDGSGTSEGEAVMILTDYVLWVGYIAKEFLPLPNSPA